MLNIFPENHAVYEVTWKNDVETGHKRQYNTAHMHSVLED
jgi:hypothetical protein